MKRSIFYFLLSTVFFGLSALAGFSPAYAGGGDTLVYENFESGQIPADWGNFDMDSLADANGRAMDWYVEADYAYGSPLPANQFLGSSSWFSNPGVADNWLVMDSFVVCDTNLYLSWKSRPFEGPVYMDGYEVWLSTTGSHPDSFTVRLEEFAEGIGATNAPNSGTVHTAYEQGRGVFQDYRSHLGPWLGDTIWLAFRHESENDNQVFLDDVLVSVLPEFDAAAIDAEFSTEYTIMPLQQTQPMFFSYRAGNASYDTLPIINVDMEARRGGSPVFTASDILVNRAPFSDTTVTLQNAFVPTVSGNYTFEVSVSLDTTDGNATNDQVSLGFAVDDSIYARDDGVVTGQRVIGGTVEALAQTFRLYQLDTLTGISAYIEQAIDLDTLRVDVYSMAGVPGALIAQSDSVLIQPGQQGWVRFEVPGIDLPLGTGNYLFAVRGSGNSAGTPIGLSSGKYTAGSGWQQISGIWASDAALGNQEVYMIRAEFGRVDEVVGIRDARTEIEAVLFPNPTTGLLQMRWEKPLKQSAQLSVVDLQGKVQWEMQVGPGTTQIKKQLPKLSAGLYFVRMEHKLGISSWKLEVLGE